jgi:hypothetical protein
MTHSITEVIQGDINLSGINCPVPIKISETMKVIYFIKRGKIKIFITESMAMDLKYYPKKQRFREAIKQYDISWQNITNTGKKVWWNPSLNDSINIDRNNLEYI